MNPFPPLLRGPRSAWAPLLRRMLFPPLALAPLVALLAFTGCKGPAFSRVEQIPDGRAVVYLYVPKGAYGDTVVLCDGQRVAELGTRCYQPHYPLPGYRHYEIQVTDDEEFHWFSQREPFHPTRVYVEAGKSYYLRVADDYNILRVDEASGLREISECRLPPSRWGRKMFGLASP
jgi:hypothetical protein